MSTQYTYVFVASRAEAEQVFEGWARPASELSVYEFKHPGTGETIEGVWYAVARTSADVDPAPALAWLAAQPSLDSETSPAALFELLGGAAPTGEEAALLRRHFVGPHPPDHDFFLCEVPDSVVSMVRGSERDEAEVVALREALAEHQPELVLVQLR